MSSSSSVPATSATSTTTTATTTTTHTTPFPTIGPELMDATGFCADSPIPANASADISHDSNINLISTIPYNVCPISTSLEQGVQQPRSNPEDMSMIQESLDNLTLDKNHTTLNGEPPLQNRPSDTYTSDEKVSTNASGNPAAPALQNTATSQPEDSAPARPMLHNSEQSSVISDGADSSPVIVVSSQSQSPEPFADQLNSGLTMLIDEPDERLLSALETPRDRLFVIKLEQDVINFIQENACEVYDLPPINAYHRLLAHKMAEYYRLTHVADATGHSVRFYRGQFARIPPIRLVEKPVAALQQNTTTNGTAPTMKIMQRTRSDKGSDTPPDHLNSTPKKASSETSSGDGSARTTTREEREQAYRQARERIFKDFVESPPETPPPVKSGDKQKRLEKPDDFSGRSQFFPVLTPPPPVINPHFYPQYESPGLQFQNTNMPVAPRFNPNTPSFNPNGNFAPQPFIPTVPNRQFQPPTDRFTTTQPQMAPQIYPQQPQHHHQQQHQQLQLQRNGLYDQAMDFNNSHPQQQQQQPQLHQHHGPMMAPSFTNPSRFIPQQPSHQSPHLQHPIPPTPASGNRHPYNSPSNYAVGNSINQQRFPQPYVSGWNSSQTGPNGIGVPMGATRSQPPMPFDRHSPPFRGMPYQSHQHQHQHQHLHTQQPWAGNRQATAGGFGRGGYGNGGGIHGPVGGM